MRFGQTPENFLDSLLLDIVDKHTIAACRTQAGDTICASSSVSAKAFEKFCTPGARGAGGCELFSVSSFLYRGVEQGDFHSTPFGGSHPLYLPQFIHKAMMLLSSSLFHFTVRSTHLSQSNNTKVSIRRTAHQALKHCSATVPHDLLVVEGSC